MVNNKQTAREIFDFHGPNAAFVRELYDNWRSDPKSVDPDTAAHFAAGLVPSPPPSSAPSPTSEAVPIEQILSASKLARLLRARGHTLARLDPIGFA
ncbi:MAG: 2-oxoglutarate dehydrogenase E1 subunit family protein, partial [Armatimonadaceae bacterium]